MRGTGEQRQFWGLGNKENQDFIFGEQRSKAIYFRGTRELAPPPPRHHHAMCMVTHIQLFCAFSVCFRPWNRKNTLRVYVRGLCDLCSCHIGHMRVREGLVGVEAWDRKWKPVPERSDCSTCSHGPYGTPKGPYGDSTAVPTLEALQGGGGIPVPLFPSKKWPCSPKTKF